MKKIISLVCVIAMLFAFAVTANAAASGALVATASTDEVTVGEEFTVTIKYVPGDGSAFKGGSVKLNWDYDVASYVKEDGMTDLSNNEGNINADKDIYVVKHTSTSNDAEVWPTLTEEAVFSVVTFKAEAVGTFELTSTGTNVTFATPDNIERQAVKEFNAVTVTVKAAKEETVNTIAATKDVEIGGNKYMGTAIYTESFNLDTIDTTKAYGIKVGDATIVSAANINGTGTVNYVLAYYGVTDVATQIGTVQSFWTAK